MNKRSKIFIISFLLFFLVHFTVADFNEKGIRHITDSEVKILQRFALYSLLLYGASIEEVVNWTCQRCLLISKDPKNIEVKPIAIGEKNATHFLAYIIANKQAEEIVITFRGTDFDDLADVRADMGSFNLVEYKFKGSQSSSSNESILVSEGFFITWKLFQSSKFTADLTSFMKTYPNFTVSSTGHSLGGALGLYQALDVKQNYPNNTKVCFYGFNIPRGGNDKFANYVDNELDCIYRVVAGGDLVSRIPPRPIWVQPKGEVWIQNLNSTNYTQVTLVCDGNDNPHCSLSIYPNFYDHFGPFFGVGFI